MSTQPPASGACASARQNGASIVVSEFPLNHHQSFRAEIIMRAGKPMVSISRLKITQIGARRTGQAFEFAAHRAAAIAHLLSEVLQALGASGGSVDPHFRSVHGVAQAALPKRNDTECRA